MTPERPTWNPPPLERLSEIVKASEGSTRQRVVERYRFVLEEFGPPAHMFLVGGIPAMFAIVELQRSFIYGNYLATIVLSQAFIEHSLGAQWSLAGDDQIARSGFAKLVKESLGRGWIGGNLAERLNQLRQMRNPYIHADAISLGKGYTGRLMGRPSPNPEAMAEDDAKEAIRIVVDYLRDGSPSWAPSRAGDDWPDDGSGLASL